MTPRTLRWSWCLVAPFALVVAAGCPTDGPVDRTDATSDAGGFDDAGPTACHGEKGCEEREARRCAGADAEVCRETDDGCLAWQVDETCDDASLCTDGACEGPCTDDCSTADATRCADGNVEQCRDHDDDSCMEWGQISNCGSGQKCYNGRCVEECDDACDTEGNTQCGEGGVQTCSDSDDDGCLEWRSGESCGSGKVCEAGECVADCSDACESDGATRCVTAGQESCSDHDDDTCLEWGSPQACDGDETCRRGRCRPAAGEVRDAFGFGPVTGTAAEPDDVAADQTGALYVTGRFHGAVDFGGTTYETGDAGDTSDVYVAKFEPGGTLQWVHTFGGDAEGADDRGTGIAVGSSGSVYATGYGSGQTTVDGQDFGSAGTAAGYVLEFDAGGSLQTSTTYDNLRPRDLEIGSGGKLYLTGDFTGRVSNLGLGDATADGDLFVAKLEPSGAEIWTASPFDAGNHEVGHGVAVDGSGRVYATGHYESGFQMTGSITFPHEGSQDLFLIGLDGSGSVEWGESITGTGKEIGRDVAGLQAGGVVLAGAFEGPATIGGQSIESDGDETDIVFGRWTGAGSSEWLHVYGGADKVDDATTVDAGPDDGIYLGGDTTSNVDLGGGSSSSPRGTFVAAYGLNGSHQWEGRYGSSLGMSVTAHQTGVTGVGLAYASVDFGPTSVDPGSYDFTQFAVTHAR